MSTVKHRLIIILTVIYKNKKINNKSQINEERTYKIFYNHFNVYFSPDPGKHISVTLQPCAVCTKIPFGNVEHRPTGTKVFPALFFSLPDNVRAGFIHPRYTTGIGNALGNNQCMNAWHKLTFATGDKDSSSISSSSSLFVQ